MDDDAYRALDLIRRGQTAELDGLEHWIEAFRTVQWVVATTGGYRLTSAGEGAFADMIRERIPSPPRPVATQAQTQLRFRR